MNKIAAIIRRDLRLGFLHGSDAMTMISFFVVVACLFPFVFGADDKLLSTAAPGIIWVSALLAAILSLEGVYHRDQADGTMDMLLMYHVSSFGIAFAKMTAHWLMSGVPLLLAAVLVSHMLLLSPAVLPVLLLSLLMGTIYLSLLGGTGAFLTAGARRPALLMAVIVFPLYIPMLILGVSAVNAALAGMAAQPYLLLQAALVIAALPLTLLASSFCLNLHLRSS